MFGKNPIRPPISGDGQNLEVKNIFATLQGEGLHVGVPSVFVRLGGCNLACNFCDAEFEDAPTILLAEIMSQVKKLAGNGIKLVVITGGEPFRQNIEPFCKILLADGFNVQIETNGTLYRELPQCVDIVCSPKNTGNGYAPIRGDLLERISALKFIISAGNSSYNHVSEIGQSKYNTPVFVQPMDEGDDTKNAENTKLALELAMNHGYRLSLQIHKILKIE
ncbi:MAG: 7-carboxy-7-deazaguanine synthase QueE [Pseudomonadota bacterium]